MAARENIFDRNIPIRYIPRVLTPHQLRKLRRAEVNGRNRLATARDLADVTQVELAAKVRITQAHISSIENGDYGQDGLPLETTRRLANFFGCSVDDLFPMEQRELAS